MSLFRKKLSLRWADLDPNYHLRHTTYHDLADQHRLEILDQLGLTLQVMKEQHFGPIIFREECVFTKEIRFSDEIEINVRLSATSADFSKWAVMHQFIDKVGSIRATLTVEGSWIDTQLRKLATPVPQVAIDAFKKIPRT